MKKLLALTLALILAVSLWVPALADGPEDPLAGELVTVELEELEAMDPAYLETQLDEGEDIPEPLPDEEPTLTLVVNGVASDAELVVEDWVTYIDAAAARELLGPAAVAPTHQGLVPLRQAAQGAGWDVEWYDGGWMGLDQQVCLWKRETFVAGMQDKFGPFQEFFKVYMDLATESLNSATPKKSSQTAVIDLTCFNTLDGNKSYTFRVRTEQVWQKGVVDTTVTLNLADLAKMLTSGELAQLAQIGGMDAQTLKGLLGAAKAEMILDTNTGGLAWKAPVLALIDPALEGWQVTYLPGFDQDLAQAAELDLAQVLYEQMLQDAELSGGVAARAEMEKTAAVLDLLLGAQRFHSPSEGSWSYTLTTDQANAALGALLDQETPGTALMKKCEISCHLDRKGNVDLTVALRPDLEGIGQAAANLGDELEAVVSSLLARTLVPDVSVKLQSKGDMSRSEDSLEAHWKNAGTLKMSATTTAGNAGTSPRQVADIERLLVYTTPQAGSFLPELDLGLDKLLSVAGSLR